MVIRIQTLAGTLAAVKLHIPLAHIEAGLRSFNRRMPEEINRVLTDHAASLLFCPTETAVNNLAKEGIQGASVHNVGDVMYDAALYYGDKAETQSQIITRLGVDPGKYILATLHRQENTDDYQRLSNILDGLANSPDPIILPLHPRTKKQIESFGLLIPKAINIIEPVGYLDMVMLEKNARLIATDSGGVQKESYFHHVPCITLREETEWVELVDQGFNTLVGSDITRIKQAISGHSTGISTGSCLYGNGSAGEQVIDVLMGCINK